MNCDVFDVSFRLRLKSHGITAIYKSNKENFLIIKVGDTLSRVFKTRYC